MSTTTTKLSSVYRKRARKELQEDPLQIPAHLTSFRRWIASMPHLSCPTNDEFLLAFLRHAKYNHSKAQTRLDNFCTFRTSTKEGCPNWYGEIKNEGELFDKLIDMKFSTDLGFVENGSLAVLVKPENLNDEIAPMDQIQQFKRALDDIIIQNESIQIGGVTVIFDFTNITAHQAKAFFNPRISKYESKYYQEVLPMRTNRMIFYNMPSFFEGIFKVIEHYLRDKIRGKMMVLSGTFQPAFEAIPGLEAVTPIEYGGKGPSFDKICASRKAELVKILTGREKLVISVDESKRPENAKNLMKVYKDVSDSVMGASGTYVKLNQDEI